MTDTLAGPALTYTDSNVVQGTTYYYRVRAENQVSDSAWSNVASILVPVPATVVYSGTIRLTKMGYCLDDRNNTFGNAPAHTLVSRVTAEPAGLGVPRSFGDYKITVDDHDLPAGVTLERLAG